VLQGPSGRSFGDGQGSGAGQDGRAEMKAEKKKDFAL